jgi:hypothetical protein
VSAALTFAPPPIATAAPTAVVGNASYQVQLLATDALIMAGTNMHTINPDWIHAAVRHYIKPSLGGEFTAIPLTTPEEFWPFGGLWDETVNDSVREGADILHSTVAQLVREHAAAGDPNSPIVAFGYSQSAAVATEVKRRLTTTANQGGTVPPLTFVVIGNAYRPNGGIGSRLAGLRLPGLTFTGATPTDTPFPTVDIARQYDPVADFPLYPANPFAMANTAVAFFYNHNYAVTTLDPTDPAYNPGTTVQQYGDTTYYFIPSEHLPLVQPLINMGFPAKAIARVEPVLKVLVERGYDRTIPAGQPTKARLFRPWNNAQLHDDLAAAWQQGLAASKVATAAPSVAPRLPLPASTWKALSTNDSTVHTPARSQARPAGGASSTRGSRVN